MGMNKVSVGKPTRGFTLIELLVVISIIALLMAIMMPALSKVRAQAKSVVCQTRMKQWGVALFTYASDYSDRLPYFVDQLFGSEEDKTYWYEALAPYIAAVSDDKRGDGFDAELRECPASTKSMPVYAGVNFCYDGKSAPFYSGLKSNGDTFPEFNMASVKDSSNAMALTDTGGYPTEPGKKPHEARWVYNPTERYMGFAVDYDGDGVMDSNRTTRPYNFGNPKVHMNGCNVLLLDSHVERVTFNDFWADQKDVGGMKVPAHPFWTLK